MPDILARMVLVLDQDGKNSTQSDPSSIASRDGLDGWVHRPS